MIRRATQADLEALSRLEGELFPVGPWSEGALRSQLDHPDGWTAVATEEGPIQAYALLRRVVDEVELLRIGVAPAFRRHGLGRALLEAGGSWAASLGAATIHLEVRARDPIATAFYRSLGFEIRGRRPHYYGAGEDALLMARSSSAARVPIP